MALFVALVTDTGWFQYSNTRARTLRLAADLMEVGVDTDHIQQLLYRSERAERVALHARGLQSLELLADGRVAVMTIRRNDFLETKSSVNDTEDLINFPLQVKAVEVAALITEPIEEGPKRGPVRVSLRSKGSVDVAKFAERFGGGGHARAAGLKLETTVAEAHDKVVEALVGLLAG
jgi:phosphoesterase RecJ-like protein